MKEIQIQKVKNPFIVEKDEIIAIECKDNETLLDIRNKYFVPDIPCVVVRNGEIVPTEQLHLSYPVHGDTIIITSDLGGGGGGGKNVLRMVLQISLIVVGAIAGQAWLGGIAASLGAGISGMTLGATIGGVVGGLLVNTLLPPPKSKLSLHGLDYDTSNAYSWNPQPTQQAGIPVPRIYGIHKVESPNIIATNIENINNKQYLNLLFCVGIGRYKNIYNVTINDQPIEYYQGVELHTRLGNLNQAIIPNFNDTKSEYSIGVKVSKGTPYTYLTVGNNFDGIEVDITFPQGLYYANDKGGLDTNSVDFSIEIRKLGNPNWTPITFKAVQVKRVTTTSRWSLGNWVWDDNGNRVWYEVQAGSSDPNAHYEGEYQRFVYNYYMDYDWYYWRWVTFTNTEIVTETVGYTTASGASNSAIRLTYKSGTITDKGKYEIRITRLTDDRTSSRYGDAMYATSVREVYTDDFTYPRHALVGIKALATDQLSGSIRLSCMVEGSMVRIYNPDTQTWTVDTTDNPAWIAYDILTKPVFDDNLNVIKYRGFQPSNIKLDEWIDAAQYFDELVPNGKGGYEKRCTFNGIFDSSTSTWSAVLDVLQVGRASPTWDGTNIGIVVDKRVGNDDLDGIVQVFGMGNIIKDSFRESWLSSSDRAAVITSDFINAEIDYQRDTFTLTNKNINSSNSVRLPLFGATKPSQVWRELMFRLKKNELLLNTVTIDAGIEAIRCTIGDKVGVSHDIPQWGYSGRILDATQTTVTLDREVTLEAGKTYAILVQNIDDEQIVKTIANSAGTYSTLTVSEPFTTVPEKYTNYAFGETQKYIKPFKVIDIRPSTDYKQRTLTLIEYNGSIYDVDYNKPTLPTYNYTSGDIFPSVTNLTLTELLIRGKDGTITDTIIVSFDSSSKGYTGGHFEIWYNFGGSWLFSGITYTNSYTLQNVEVNKTYQIAVVPVNYLGQKQSIDKATKSSIYTLGKLTPPSNVTNFTARQNQTFVEFSWEHIPDADLYGYELREGIYWDSARVIATAISHNNYLYQPELNGTYRYMIKAIDDSGLYSITPAIFDFTVKSIDENLNIILSQDEMTKDNPADGAKTNFIYVPSHHALMQPHSISDTDVPNWTDLTPDIADYDGSINLYSEYVTNVIDTYKDSTTWIRIQEALDAIDTLATDLSYPDRTDISYPEDTDTHITAPVDFSMYFQISSDGATYSDWQRYFGVIQEQFRYVRIKIIVNVASQTEILKLQKFLLSFDVPDIEFSIRNFAVSASGNDITFTDYGYELYTKPIIRASVLDSTINKVPVISNLSATGFHIDLFNASNTKVAGNVDIEVTGY